MMTEKVTEEETNQKEFKTRVPCKECGGKIYTLILTQDMLNSIEKYPFTIVCMHVGIEEKKETKTYFGKEVHTMVAYIDKDLHCRHVEVLTGKRVYVTPYILYNPKLLQLTCNKLVSKF